MSLVRVSWLEVSLGEYVVFVAVTGTAVATAQADGHARILARQRPGHSPASPRPVHISANARGIHTSAIPRGDHQGSNARGPHTPAKERLEWAP